MSMVYKSEKEDEFLLYLYYPFVSQLWARIFEIRSFEAKNNETMTPRNFSLKGITTTPQHTDSHPCTHKQGLVKKHQLEEVKPPRNLWPLYPTTFSKG